MSKSVLLLLIALLGCAYTLHMQTFAPSKPGGTYTPTNGTSSTSTNVTPMINGKPYVYNGPFTLACWLPNNTQTPYRWDTCYNADACYRMLLDYRNCQGSVRKYPPVQ